MLLSYKMSLRIVAPLAGAWIEIPGWTDESVTYNKVAPLAGAWIEILDAIADDQRLKVAPLAGAWIEIPWFFLLLQNF